MMSGKISNSTHGISITAQQAFLPVEDGTGDKKASLTWNSICFLIDLTPRRSWQMIPKQSNF